MWLCPQATLDRCTLRAASPVWDSTADAKVCQRKLSRAGDFTLARALADGGECRASSGGRCFVLPLRAKSGRGVGAEGGLERAV